MGSLMADEIALTSPSDGGGEAAAGWGGGVGWGRARARPGLAMQGHQFKKITKGLHGSVLGGYGAMN